MAYTQADVDAVKQMLIDRKGTKTLTMENGQSVTFESYDDMRKWLADMQQEVNAAGGNQTRTRLAATCKGV